MHTEIQYRTFDDLLDSVKIDLKGVDLEGMIESQELIKVAMKINRELGLKIHSNKETCLEIHNGKVRLPEDFHVLNFAMVCDTRYATHSSTSIPRKTYEEGALDTLGAIQEMFHYDTPLKQFTTKMNINPGVNRVRHTLNTTEIMIQVQDPSGHILSFEFLTPNPHEVIISSSASVSVQDVKVIMVGKMMSLHQNTGTASVDIVDNNPVVKYLRGHESTQYANITPLVMEKSVSVSSEACGVHSKQGYRGKIKNNFLEVNFPEGVVYINYASAMEDEEGNLLTIDHPFTNEYYEYALKERIFENLILNGETTMGPRFQLVASRLRGVRNNALSYVNTPDFKDLRRIKELNRKAQYHKYVNMFKS
jgi:hypothetical protein